MTDSEIIKDFTEIVEFVRACGNLKKEENILGNVLDLITRQQAENKWLRNSQVVHIDINEQFQKECEYEMKEAIKGFAERLKERAFIHEIPFEANEDKYIKLVAVKQIDNLVKEMTGDNNAE